MDSGFVSSRSRTPMRTRAVSSGDAGAATTPAGPDPFHDALLVVAAAAGLVWALAHGTSDDTRDEPALKPSPDTPRHAIG